MTTPPAVTGYVTYSSTAVYSGDTVNALSKNTVYDAQIAAIQSSASSLSAQVSSQVAKESDDISQLTATLATETARALASESVLTSSLASESSTRLSAFNYLNSRVNDEIARASGAERDLSVRATADEANISSLQSAMSAMTSRVATDEDTIATLSSGLSAQVAKELADQVQNLAVEKLIEQAVNNVQTGENSLWSEVSQKASAQAVTAVYATFKNFLDIFFSQYNLTIDNAKVSSANFIPYQAPVSVFPPSSYIPFPQANMP